MNTEKKTKKDKNNNYHDVAGIICVVVSAFFLICLITPLLSDIGVFIKRVTTGIFGFISYPLFLCMLLCGILMLMHKSPILSKRQMIFIILMSVFALLILHTALDASRMNTSLGNYLSTLISLNPDNLTAGRSVGGVLLGLVAYGVKAIITFVGAYVLYSLLLVLFAALLIFDIRSDSKTKTKKKKKVPPFVKGMSEPQPVHNVYDPTLFVGTIEPHRTPNSDSGNFSSMYNPMPDSMPRYEPAAPVQSAPQTDDDSQKAKKLLMGDSDEMLKAYNDQIKNNMQIKEFKSGRSNYLVNETPKYKTDFLPYHAVSSPSVSQQKPKQALPEVPFVPEKDISAQIYEGPIVNGEEFARQMQDSIRLRKPPEEMPTMPSATCHQQPPIVNGDTFVRSAPAQKPTLKPDARPDIVNGEDFSDSFEAWSKAVKSNNNTDYVDKSEPVKPIEPVRHVEQAKPIEFVKPIESVKSVERGKPIEPIKPIETDEAGEQAAMPPFADKALAEGIDEDEKQIESIEETAKEGEPVIELDNELEIYEGVEHASVPNDDLAQLGDVAQAQSEVEEIAGEQEVSALSNEQEPDSEAKEHIAQGSDLLEQEAGIERQEPDSDDQDIDQELVSADGESDIEQEPEEPKSYFEGEIEAAKADESLYIDDEEPEEEVLEEHFGVTINGKIPDTLKLEDEEVDLSETHDEIDDDNTGYYTQKQKFDKRVDELSLKLKDGIKDGNGANNQINMDDYNVEVPPTPPKKKKHARYTAPPIDMLINSSTQPEYEDHEEKARALEEVLHNLRVDAKVINITQGPAVTRYELEVPLGQTVKRIPNCADDIAYSLASNGKIRIEAPIKGKRAVGVEVPNASIATVSLREIIDSNEFNEAKSCLTLALGKDITGNIITCNLEKMPHLLIAGTTGSGKSACLNSIIISILYKATPDEVRLILIDPKQVEFVLYRDMPHLLMKNIINDCQQAINAFKWAREEMDRRYTLFSKYAVRNLADFNECAAVKTGMEQKIPRIVIIVDELGELMLAKNSRELEQNIMSMAQKARAAGMHLILATQRPSVDVLTGTIKANLPSRIAFAVKSIPDSRTILDHVGAETLLGMGDMLYSPLNANEPTRVQGAFITTEEVENIVNYVRANNDVDYDEAAESIIMKKQEEAVAASDDDKDGEQTEDPLMKDVLRRVIESKHASASMIQRRFAVGYNKASRIIDQMEERGYIGPLDGAKPREIFITAEMFKSIYGEDA